MEHCRSETISMNERAVLPHTKPLFLIGAPRSGTTILTKLLNAHSEIQS